MADTVMQRFAKPNSDEVIYPSRLSLILYFLIVIGHFLFDVAKDNYYRVYSIREKLLSFLVELTVVLICIQLILFLMNDNNLMFIWSSVYIYLASIFIYRTATKIHKWIGNKLVLLKNEEETIEYIQSEAMPHVAKVYNKTGAGKDSLVTGFISVLTEFLYNMSLDELDYYMSIDNFTDFIKLNQFLNEEENAKKYFTASVDYQRDQFKKDLLKNDFFDRSYKRSRFIIPHIDLLIYDWEQMRKDLNYVPKYKDFIYDSGLGKKHSLEILFDYVKEYLRVYYVKSYAGSNQPIIQFDDKDGILMTNLLGSKALESGKPQEYELTMDDETYIVRDKIQSPIPKKYVISITEAGLVDSNVDASRRSQVIETGSHLTPMLIRHLHGENCYLFKIDQEDDRELAVTRGLYRHYIFVRKMRIVYTRDTSYLEKIRKKLILKQRRRYSFDRRTKIRRISMKIDKLKSKSFLKWELVIADKATISADKTTFKKLLDKDRVPPDAYEIELTLARKKSHGKNNTHVMGGLGEQRNKRATINPFTADFWDNNVEQYSEEELIKLDYEIMNNIGGITLEKKIQYDLEKGNKSRFEVEEKG